MSQARVPQHSATPEPAPAPEPRAKPSLRILPPVATDQLRRAQTPRLERPLTMCPVCGLWRMEPCACCPEWAKPLVILLRRLGRSIRSR